MKACVAVVLLLAALLPGRPASVEGGAADSLAGAPPFRRLFLDASVTERSGNLTRTFHALVRHPGNPVIRKDRPYEGWGPYLYGTVLREDGRFRMWYQTVGAEGSDVCYAESGDGLRWTKPDLALHPLPGTPRTNIVAPANTHIASVIRLPDAPPEHRYAMYSFGGSLGPHVAYSADGLRWEGGEAPAQSHLFASSDVLNVFHDPYRNRFVATRKTAARRHRAVGLAVSPDGLHWTVPTEGAVFAADDLDPDPTQVYGMPAFPYQGLYIGLPWIYHARYIKYGRYSADRMREAQEGSPRAVDVQLAWSWDMLHWTRTPRREPFLPLGPAGAFDSQMVFTARAPVRVGDRLFFYYGGFDRPHDEDGAHGAIGLATLRLDGFCSMDASDREGWLISRREVFSTPEVAVNAVTRSGGSIAAEILDRNDRVIPGFSRQDCIPFTGDSVRAVLRWKTAAFPPRWAKADKKVRFLLRRASLYSYLPSGIDLSADDGFPDP